MQKTGWTKKSGGDVCARLYVPHRPSAFLAGFHENSPTKGGIQLIPDPNALYASDGVGDVTASANFSGTEKDWFQTSAFVEQYLVLESRINNYALEIGMN